MRYKVDTETETIAVMSATGEELLELAEKYPDYRFQMGTETYLTTTCPNNNRIGDTIPYNPSKPFIYY